VIELLINLFPSLAEKLASYFGKITFNVSKVEMKLDKPKEPDGDGGFNHGSYGNFTLEIINKKGVDVILEDIHCVAYCGETVLQNNICCNNRATYRKIAMRPTYDALSSLSIPPKGIMSFDIGIRPSKDLSKCDKIALSYRIGTKRKEIAVYKQDGKIE